jgi:threonine dehydrogenase-like Zn-dependent dehydrogenase
VKSFQAISVTGRETAELVERQEDRPLAPDQVEGSTLFTLVSPGTELAGIYLGERFPAFPGYAAVFRVEEIGSDVQDVDRGDLLFCMGNHHAHQRVRAADAVPVPAGLAPEHAPFCRLMGVTMATLQTTSARPPATVLVTGLGPVGHLGAQVFGAYGYDVLAVDPIEQRRQWASHAGIKRVFPAVPSEDPDIVRKVALHLECSGNEQAALDGCRVVMKKGEVALVGAPWSQRADIQAHEFLREIFFNYVVLRSGWEWELPHHATDFRSGSIFGNYAEALRLLCTDSILLDGLYELLAPADCQAVYQDLMQRRSRTLFQVFDWGSYS